MEAQETEALVMVLMWLHMDDDAFIEAQERLHLWLHMPMPTMVLWLHMPMMVLLSKKKIDGATISMSPGQGELGDECSCSGR